jgi:uncharacterized protein involved in type VI secretion and phage assembly
MNSLGTLPSVSIELSSTSLDVRDQSALEAVRVEQRLSLPAQCELIFRQPEPSLTDSALASHGRSLRVRIPEASVPLFEGEVTAVEQSYEAGHGNTLRIRAYDLLHRLRKSQPVRVHVQTTVAELAKELTADLGITVHADADGPLLKRIIQHRQSDFDLLVESLESCGLFGILSGNVLRVLTLEGAGEPIPLTLGEGLLETHVTVNGDSTCRSVAVSTWDLSRVERHQGRATSARSGRSTASDAAPDYFGVSGERQLTAEFTDDDRQAEALAQAELDLRAAREVTLRATAEGRPTLIPGARIEILGVAASLCGTYVLTAVTHRIERSTGFVSELSTEPPLPRPRARYASVALGIVTRVNDPDGLGRVRVSLPSHGDLETDWMSVLSPGAGRGKGFALLPDTGDQVLVLFARDNSAHGVVLGGLFGSATPPDSVIDSGGVVRYSLRTHGGQKLVFDDHGRSIRLEDPAGNYFELSPDRLMLHSSVPLQIEAIGQPVLIRGKAIHFEET